MRPRTLAPTALLLALLSTPAAAAPGDPDLSFGSNGSVDLMLGASDDVLTSLLLRADGKLVAVGRIGDDIGLARYLPDGTLDSTFGVGGRARYRRPDIPARPTSAVEQADGKVVVLATCGSLGFQSIANAPRPCIYRFNTDGSRDTTLEPDAVAAAGFPNLAGFGSVALQSDGRILLTWSSGNAPYHFGAIRLLPTGQVDTSFGTAGRSFADGEMFLAARGLAVQPDGKILVHGRIEAGIGSRFAMARFNADGSRDTSFSAAGAAGDNMVAFALQPDGKIVLSGCRHAQAAPYGDDPALFRLGASGALDTSFGSAGVVTYPGLGCGTNVLVRSDGRIVAAEGGQYLAPSKVAQFLPNGTPDNSFGTNGAATFAAGGNGDHAAALVLQPDGKLVAGGTQWQRDFALIRFDVAGANDPSFGTAGLVVTDFFNGRTGSVAAVRPANGKLVVVVSYNDTGTADGHPVLPDTAVTRLNADGTIDTSFGTNGMFQVNARLGIWEVLPDGSLVVAGTTFVAGSPASVRRILTDGTFDTAFGSGGAWTVTDASINAVKAMADGRIVVSGVSFAASGAPGVMVARLLANGQPDPSFGSGGLVRIATQAFQSTTLGGDVEIQPDGKIVIGSATTTPFSAMRLLANGSPDPAFGAGGQAALIHPREPQGRYASFSSVLVHADGRVTLAGTETGKRVHCSTGDIYGANVAFGRLSPTGGTSLATPGAGFLSGQLATNNPRLTRARLDAADRVVASGTKANGCVMGVSPGELFPGTTAIAMRFTPSGALDTRFGNGGIVQLVSSAYAQSHAGDVVVEAGGRLIIATTTHAGYSTRLTLQALQGGGDSAPLGPPTDVDNDGAPNVVEQQEGRDPFVRDNDVFASSRLYVMQQYRDFLGREGDAAGIASWTNFMTGAENRATVADSFLRSPEFEGTGAPMTRLYFAYFLRIPDYDGLTFWIGQYRGGQSLVDVSNAFAQSPEFVNTYGALDNAGFVDRVYRNVLGRAPDGPGLAHWRGQLDAGMTRGRMMVEFSESAEYRGLIASEVYATMVYAGMLRRAPDATGFSFWVSYLDAGNTGIAMIDGVLAGAEYRGRFLP